MRLISLLVMFLAFAQMAEAQDWISSMKNIPLAPGLKEVPDQGSVMEGPLGPIIIAYARGDGPADKVRGFYDETLPAMGWEKQGNKWRHESLLLALDFVGTGRDPVIVTFTLHGSK